MQNHRKLIFFGNSLTAGYGIGQALAYPALIQQKIQEKGLAYKVINAGLSGETSAGGTVRVDRVLQEPVDIFALELGANDGLRGIPARETTQNLETILDKVRHKAPEAEILLIGMEIPQIFAHRYLDEFRMLFRKVAEKHQLPFVPFLLEGVAGHKHLNLPDGVHPNAAGHKIMAENVWRGLQTLLLVRESEK